MKNPNNIAHTFADQILTTHQLEAVRKALVQAPDEALNGRSVLPTRNVGAAAQRYEYTTVVKYGDAEAVRKGSDAPGLLLDGTPTDVEIPKYFLGFEIPREDVLTSKSLDQPLDTRYAERTGQKLKEKENYTIWSGNARYGISGIISSASQSNTGTDWTAGTTQYTDVLDSVNALGNNYNAKAGVFNKTQYGELHMTNTNTDNTYMNLVTQGLGLKVFWDKDMTAAAAIIMDVGANIAELVIAEELSMEMDYPMATKQTHHAIGWLRSVPVIYDGNAVCSTTTL